MVDAANERNRLQEDRPCTDRGSIRNNRRTARKYISTDSSLHFAASCTTTPAPVGRMYISYIGTEHRSCHGGVEGLQSAYVRYDTVRISLLSALLANSSGTSLGHFVLFSSVPKLVHFGTPDKNARVRLSTAPTDFRFALTIWMPPRRQRTERESSTQRTRKRTIPSQPR